MKPAAATSALLAGVQRRHGWFPGLFALERGWAGAQPLAVPVLFSSVLLRGGVSAGHLLISSLHSQKSML